MVPHIGGPSARRRISPETWAGTGTRRQKPSIASISGSTTPSVETDVSESVACPVMKETCQFWEDQSKILPNGRLVVPDGWSPEHGPHEDGCTYYIPETKTVISFWFRRRVGWRGWPFGEAFACAGRWRVTSTFFAIAGENDVILLDACNGKLRGGRNVENQHAGLTGCSVCRHLSLSNDVTDLCAQPSLNSAVALRSQFNRSLRRIGQQSRACNGLERRLLHAELIHRKILESKGQRRRTALHAEIAV